VTSVVSDRRKAIEEETVPPSSLQTYRDTKRKLLEMYHSAHCEARLSRAAGRHEMAERYEEHAARAQHELRQLEVDFQRWTGQPLDRTDWHEFARVNNLSHLED
jgi:hypothetical protein